MGFKSWVQGFIDSWFFYLMLRFLPRRLVDDIPLLPIEHRSQVFSAGEHVNGPVVVVCNGFEREGAQLSALEIVKGLVQACSVPFAIVGPRPGPLASAYEDLGLEVRYAEPPQSGRCSGSLYEQRLEAYNQQVIALKPSLMLVFSLDSFHAIDAAKACGVPAIWAVRESKTPQHFYAGYPYAIQQRAMRSLVYPAAVVFLDESIGRWWPHGPARRIIPTRPDKGAVQDRVSAQLANPRGALGLSADAFVLLCVATVCDGKGQRVLLDALLAMEIVQAPMVLLLIGRIDESVKKDIEIRVRRLRRKSNLQVVLAGSQSVVGDYYSVADAYVSCSASEGIPRSMFEALAAGLPIFASDILPHRLLLQEVDACFHRQGDARMLADQLRALDSPHRDAMAQSSKKKWAQLDGHQEMILAYRELLDEYCLQPLETKIREKV